MRLYSRTLHTSQVHLRVCSHAGRSLMPCKATSLTPAPFERSALMLGLAQVKSTQIIGSKHHAYEPVAQTAGPGRRDSSVSVVTRQRVGQTRYRGLTSGTGSTDNAFFIECRSATGSTKVIKWVTGLLIQELERDYTRDWLPAYSFVVRTQARRDTTRQDCFVVILAHTGVTVVYCGTVVPSCSCMGNDVIWCLINKLMFLSSWHTWGVT
jgi:hypothetical protein